MAKTKELETSTAVAGITHGHLLPGWETPAQVREGVLLTLPGTDYQFRIRLPSKFNKPYARAIGTAMFSGTTINAAGRVEVGSIDVAGLRDAKMQAFADHCLIMPLPGGITTDSLMADYFPAFEWLFDEAERLAEQCDEQAETARKKLKAS